MKEYTFQEVITNIKIGETYKCTDVLYGLQTITKDNIGFKFNKDSVANFSGTNDIQKFVKVEKSVSFIEAVASNNRIKVIHNNFVSTDRFMTILEMFECMSRYRRPIELINDGKWYIEE